MNSAPTPRDTAADSSASCPPCPGPENIEWKDAPENSSSASPDSRDERLRQLGLLTGRVAHDFNNLLSAILAYADLALLETANHPAANDYITQVLVAGDRAKHLVRQLMTLSGGNARPTTRVSLKTIISEVTNLLQPSIPTNVSVSVEIDPTTPSVPADATQAHEALMNLCVNALHAMQPEGGALRVVLEPREIDSEASASSGLPMGLYAALAVEDTGPGIDPSLHERIFEPFFTTKSSTAGSGLGLAVVRSVMKEHGGAARLSSRRGEGARFELLFPTTERSAAPDVPTES